MIEGWCYFLMENSHVRFWLPFLVLIKLTVEWKYDLLWFHPTTKVKMDELLCQSDKNNGGYLHQCRNRALYSSEQSRFCGHVSVTSHVSSSMEGASSLWDQTMSSVCHVKLDTVNSSRTANWFWVGRQWGVTLINGHVWFTSTSFLEERSSVGEHEQLEELVERGICNASSMQIHLWLINRLEFSSNHVSKCLRRLVFGCLFDRRVVVTVDVWLVTVASIKQTPKTNRHKVWNGL